MSKIAGGYFIMARAIQESVIAQAPPCTRELWVWLIRSANFKLNARSNIKRGELIATTEDMKNGLSWQIGYRKESYTTYQIDRSLSFLKKEKMISSKRTSRGLRITICKYDYYQDFDNYDVEK